MYTKYFAKISTKSRFLSQKWFATLCRNSSHVFAPCLAASQEGLHALVCFILRLINVFIQIFGPKTQPRHLFLSLATTMEKYIAAIFKYFFSFGIQLQTSVVVKLVAVDTKWLTESRTKRVYFVLQKGGRRELELLFISLRPSPGCLAWLALCCKNSAWIQLKHWTQITRLKDLFNFDLSLQFIASLHFSFWHICNCKLSKTTYLLPFNKCYVPFTCM